MQDFFTVEVDHGSRLMNVTVRGFWNADIFGAFLKEVERCEAKLATSGKTYFVLSDLSEFPVQSRELSDSIEVHLQQWSSTGAYSAFVVPSALATMQLSRLAQGGNRKFYKSIGEANEWLRSMGLDAPL